jgi:hypothetical protein
MKKRKAKGEGLKIFEIDDDALKDFLVRTEKLLPETDFALLSMIVSTLLTAARLLRNARTESCRLKRLFRLFKSEKTAELLNTTPPESNTTPPESSNSEQPTVDGSNDANAGDTSSGDSSSPPEKPKREGHGRIPNAAFKGARRHFVPHATLSHGDLCPDCTSGHVRRLKKPATRTRFEGHAPIGADIWEQERLRCDCCGEIFTADPPPEAPPEGAPTWDETATAMLGLVHYGNGVPFHRLEKLQEHVQIPVPASTQFEVLAKAAPKLQPVLDEIKSQAAQGGLVQNDDTTARVLELMGKRRKKKIDNHEIENPDRTGIFTTAIASLVKDDETGDEKTIALFATGPKHAGENLDDLLDKREPALDDPLQMSDALARNLPKRNKTRWGNCLIHMRRYFVDQLENFPKECGPILLELRQIFKNDDIAIEQQMDPVARMQFHRKESMPILIKVRRRLSKLIREKKIEPNSELGAAWRYLVNHWKELTLFVREPGVPLTNNLVERILKVAVLYRKNSYFYRSHRGAAIGDLYMTLIHTAVLNGENPFHYLTELLRNAEHVAESPQKWLPWNYRATLDRLKETNQKAA